MFALAFVFVSCAVDTNTQQIGEREHEAERDAWILTRNEDLIAEDGWLNLIGLHWLHPGFNRMGIDEGSEILLSEGKLPEKVGEFLWLSTDVIFVPAVDGVIVDGIATAEEVMAFDAERLIAPIMDFESLRWQVVKRGDGLGVRLRDLQSKSVTDFREVDRYPRNISWRIVAKYSPYVPPKSISLENALGQTIPTPSIGKVCFEAQGKSFELDVFEEEEQLFLIFADETSGSTTYGGGRYLYAERADEEDRVVLDFNKAINPPCVFTPYATRPLPSKKNAGNFNRSRGTGNLC